MKHLRQRFAEHNPDDGLYGDCFRTCEAMVLGRDPETIPNWTEPDWSFDWRNKRAAWWAQQGLATIELPLPTWSIDTLLFYLRIDAKAPIILGAKSPRGAHGHCVVVYEGKIVDPHPSDAGVHDPDETYPFNNVAYLLVPIQ